MVATHIKNKEQHSQGLVSFEKAALSSDPQKVRFQIKAVQPNSVEDLLQV
jgi:hypothetical protein